MLSLAAGCGEKKAAKVRVPSPPPIYQPSDSTRARNHPPLPSQQPTEADEPDAYANVKPIYVETGTASWYGPPYHNRKSANGEVFDMNLPSAAHKTLPMNSIVRVTNLSNGKKIVLRIQDRGPFVGARILDLSLGAAKAIGVWRTGLAQVRLEVLETPAPIAVGGRWCVQIGAFTDSTEAAMLKEKLMRKYQTAKVIQFAGPTGDWVRIRPLNDDRKRAEEVARVTKVNEGGVFLVRLD